MVARLQLASHVVAIERVKDGKFSDLASGGSVYPEETLRYSARFGWQWSSAWVKFSVTNLEGATIWGPEEANANLAGNAWFDANAPVEPGLYTLVAEGYEGVPGTFGAVSKSHTMERTFRVDRSAPAVPGGGVFPGLPGLPGLLGNPWALVIILGFAIAIGILI